MKSIYKSAEGERAVRERYLGFLKHWPAANEHVRVPTREGETFVVVSGPREAPPLMLFHGSMANSAMWMGDVARWAEHFRVYAVDMIGEAGLSAQSRPPLEGDAHALWLDDVLHGLALTRASMVGASLGGWLALDYAIRRPERVKSLAVLCPGGIGRQKIGFVLKIAPLLLLGKWGMRKAGEIALGRLPKDAPPAVKRFAEFTRLIQENLRPRRVRLPIFGDSDLGRLKAPLMAIAGGKDQILDSDATRDRLQRIMPQAEVRYLPDAGHFIPRQTMPILEFLQRSDCSVTPASLPMAPSVVCAELKPNR